MYITLLGNTPFNTETTLWVGGDVYVCVCVCSEGPLQQFSSTSNIVNHQEAHLIL